MPSYKIGRTAKIILLVCVIAISVTIRKKRKKFRITTYDMLTEVMFS